MKRGTRTIIIQDIDAQELYGKIREIVTDILRKEQPPPSENSRLLSLQETADFFSVTVRTIHNWSQHNLLSPISIGRRIYYEETQVMDLVQKNKVKK